MYLFWWTGKGYLALLILFVTLLMFGLALKAGEPFLSDTQSFWGVALLISSIANWFVGRKQNAKKINAIRTNRIRDKFFYRARNKFMSLPFETWSIPMAACGVYMIAKDIFVL